MKPPNVVFIITDDQGYGDLHCHGNQAIHTPMLDDLHADSIRLTDYHVGPTCAPARAGLLTGRYCNCTGVWHTIAGRSLLRRDETTIADVFRAEGYRTGLFGKWHLGDNYPFRPHDRGFDEALYHGGGGVSQAPDYWRNDYFDDTYFRNGQPERCAGYCTDVWFREGLRFIERNQDQPFFCYISTNAPHTPLNVPDRYVQPYRGRMPEERARFYGMIACIDENVGRLRVRLNELELSRDTILIFMTDNGTASGCALDAQGFVTNGFNAGMRGIKGSEYDGGHRVPFFLCWPGGGLTGGRDVARLTSHIDILPTLASLCGFPDRVPSNVHGRSLVPLMHEAVQGAAVSVVQSGRDARGPVGQALQPDTSSWLERTIVTDSQRVAHPIKWRKSATMTDRWRLVNGCELYDIKPDPEQRHDVAANHPEVVTRLRSDYEAWWAVVSERFSEEIPIVIGSDSEPDTRLSSHDWHTEEGLCPWNQGQVRHGMVATGHWAIDVARGGMYRVELRRWPREVASTLTQGVGDEPAPDAGVDPGAMGWYVGGTPLTLGRAFLTIGEQDLSAEVRPDDGSVEFEVRLPAGPTTLEAWFEDAEQRKIGAYYVHVRCQTGEAIAVDLA